MVMSYNINLNNDTERSVNEQTRAAWQISIISMKKNNFKRVSLKLSDIGKEFNKYEISSNAPPKYNDWLVAA